MQMNNSKRFWQSRTLWFNAIAFGLTVLAAFGYEGTLPEDWAPFVVPVVALINGLLRIITEKRLTP